MINDLKGSFKGSLNSIPIIMALGIIIGVGAHSVIVGSIIITVIMFLVNRKIPFIYSVTIPFGIILSFANTLTGNAIYPLLFATGLFTIFLTFFNISKRTILKIPKSAANGFISGCFSAGLILGFSLILGDKSFSSISLIPFSVTDFFEIVNPNSIVMAAVVFAVYYYLNKSKIKSLPSSFLAVFAGVIVNFIYRMNLPAVNTTLKSYSTYYVENVPNAIYFILISIFLSIIFTAHTLLNLKALKRKVNLNEFLFGIGLSNILCALNGSVGGTLSAEPSKKSITNNDTPLFCLVTKCTFFLPFILFFDPICRYIPISAVAAILTIKCYEALKHTFLSIKAKNKQYKIIFISCLFTCLYNIILGASVAGIITLMTRKTQK